jgi:hypothetical protein
MIVLVLSLVQEIHLAFNEKCHLFQINIQFYILIVQIR